jgi:hypothetical protein
MAMQKLMTEKKWRRMMGDVRKKGFLLFDNWVGIKAAKRL